MRNITVTRTEHTLLLDRTRVLAKPYMPGDEAVLPGTSRASQLMERVLAIPDAQVAPLLVEVLRDFSHRHRDFEETLERNFQLVAHHVGSAGTLSPERRQLVGAYFTHEFSVEAAALLNPSIVLAPDQQNLRSGQRRFLMSLRAVGEGHLSSIEFRTGIVDPDSAISLDPPGAVLVSGRRTPPSHYDKSQFSSKLQELGVENKLSLSVLSELPERFTLAELEGTLAHAEESGPPHAIWYETFKIMRVLAASNYVTTFPPTSTLGERILFPAGPRETRGMEDARFVRFTDDDGAVRYYATYTAFDGFQIFPQLIETEDFLTFRILTLNGEAAQNKGMALFPRKVAGRYMMLSRKDRENLHLAVSDDVRLWQEVTELCKPSRPWELLHIGNCGSPLETEAGWLVLTHGVGPMRRYVISAMLLDLDDPRKVIGYLDEPLLRANAEEREGYVPNVVYTCGGLINGDKLILPYGFSDVGVQIALVSMPELLSALISQRN